MAIWAKDLSKTYWFYEKEAGLSGSIKALFRGKKVFVEAVKGINMDIGLGEVVGFIGPNGAGKTTTLKMLSGILRPSSGAVNVLGYVPGKREKNFLKSITFVPGQRNRLFWDLPAEEYFEFCRAVYEVPEERLRHNLDRLVELAEIGDILRVPQRKLSTGQRKRCELVAALLHDPKVTFLDEPTNGMDLINARKVREFIKNMGKEKGHTVLLTSHNMSDIEQVCDRVIIINQGVIVFDGKIDQLQKLNGSRRQIRVVFKDLFPIEEIGKLGIVRGGNGQEMLIEVPADESGMIVSQLCSHFSVKDLSVTEPRLEEVIEEIYYQRGDG
jgi:ABC-2 type transport system ATP-binding protein